MIRKFNNLRKKTHMIQKNLRCKCMQKLYTNTKTRLTLAKKMVTKKYGY